MIAHPLSELCDVTMGQAPDGSSYNTDGRGLPLIAGASDLGDLTPRPSRWTSTPTQRCRQGDIVLCIRATIGDRNWADREYCLGRGVAGLRAKPGRLEPRFLWHWLSVATPRLLHAARGATFLQVSRRDIESLTVPAPESLAEQRRIADFLDKADAVRRRRSEATGLADDMLRAAFLDLVGPGASDYATWSPRSFESLAADRPDAMRTGPFGSDLLHSEFVKEGIAVLGIDNAVHNRFSWGERRFVTPEKYQRLRRYTVFPGDVIVTIMGTTGRSAVVPDDIPAAITTKHLATITLDRSKAEPEFVSQALFRHPDVLRQIAAVNRGAIMSGLNLGLIKSLRVPVPPIQRQHEFSRIAARIRTMTGRLEAARVSADGLFESLVVRAFHTWKGC